MCGVLTPEEENKISEMRAEASKVNWEQAKNEAEYRIKKEEEDRAAYEVAAEERKRLEKEMAEHFALKNNESEQVKNDVATKDRPNYQGLLVELCELNKNITNIFNSLNRSGMPYEGLKAAGIIPVVNEIVADVIKNIEEELCE